MNQLAEREQLRLKDLPSMDQINAKDQGLGQLLGKLTASISGRRVDVSPAGTVTQACGKWENVGTFGSMWGGLIVGLRG